MSNWARIFGTAIALSIQERGRADLLARSPALDHFVLSVLKMPNPLPRPSLLALAAALVFAASSRSSGEEPGHEFFYATLDPKEPFKYTWKGKSGRCAAGVFRWEVPKSEFGTSGLDRNFTGYCAEVLVPITANTLYRFRVNSLYAPENYGIAAREPAERRVKFIQELFGRYFRDPMTRAVTGEDAAAFQVALWEIVQESEPRDAPPKLDLFAGDFQADYPRATAPGFVLKAELYLDSLTGNDNLYYENPDLRGRELIRFQGIENAAGNIAQSQFALRSGGWGGGGNLGAQLAGGGFGGGLLGGFGGLGGGSAFGGGAGGALISGGGGSGSGGGAGSTSPGTAVTTSPVGSPSTIASPPGSSVTTPPVNGPDTSPPVPVPAPAGLVLTAIGVSVVGVWLSRARWPQGPGTRKLGAGRGV